jgi:hypothetical protein
MSRQGEASGNGQCSVGAAVQGGELLQRKRISQPTGGSRWRSTVSQRQSPGRRAGTHLKHRPRLGPLEAVGRGGQPHHVALCGAAVAVVVHAHVTRPRCHHLGGGKRRGRGGEKGQVQCKVEWQTEGRAG